MKRKFLGIFLMSLTWLLPAITAQSSNPDEKALAALEQKWLSAVDDPVELDSILASDFVHVLPQGLITKQEQIDFVRRHPAPATTRRFEDLKVRIYGHVGIVNGVVVATSAKRTQRTLFTDVFVKRADKWEAVNAQENPATH